MDAAVLASLLKASEVMIPPFLPKQVDQIYFKKGKNGNVCELISGGRAALGNYSR